MHGSFPSKDKTEKHRLVNLESKKTAAIITW